MSKWKIVKTVLILVLLMVIVAMIGVGVQTYKVADQYQQTLQSFRQKYDRMGKMPILLTEFTDVIQGKPEVVELGEVKNSREVLEIVQNVKAAQTKRSYRWKSRIKTYEIVLTVETNDLTPDHPRIVAYEAKAK